MHEEIQADANYYILTDERADVSDSVINVIVEVCFVLSLFAVTISVRLIVRHLEHFSQPIIQRKIIAILWMVPIYAVSSWMSLVFVNHSMFLDMIRDCYESFVIYTFFALCYCYIGQFDQDHIDPSLIYGVLSRKGHVRHLFSWLKYLGVSEEIDLKDNPQLFLLKCKKYILQFVLIKPLGTVVAMCLSQFSLYENGDFSFHNGYIYITSFTNCSITLSMYWMVMFYMAVSDALAPFRPVPKFLCIKGVLFFSYWQSVTVAVLVKFGVITDLPIIHYTVDHVASTVQNCLICLEMVGFAIAHSYSFDANPFLILPRSGSVALVRQRSTVASARSMLRNAIDVGDIVEDIHEVAPVIPIPRFLKRRNSTIANCSLPSSQSVSGPDSFIAVPNEKGLLQLQGVLHKQSETDSNN